MSIWINKKTKKQYTLLVSTGWAMLVYQLLRAKRERGEGVGVGEGGGVWVWGCGGVEYLWLYPFGYFHYASYFT